MITLNLIPPAKKKNLQTLQILLIVKNNLTLLFFVLSFSAVIFLMSKAIIDDHFANVVSQSTLTTKYARLFNQEIKEFNLIAEAADQIQNRGIPWLTFLPDLAENIPEGVKLSYLEIKDGRVVINGNAQTRNDLIKLKENLEKFSILSGVNIPLENLLKKDDINFSIKAAYDIAKLKKYGQ